MYGISRNNKNEPDILGYELKISSTKITLGDFSACEYLYEKLKSKNKKIEPKCTRSEFITYFGTHKENKNRYSWSGSCVPKVNNYNDCGQILVIENDDICIYYSYEKDKRSHKENFPDFLKTEDKMLIALWYKEKMKKNIENKFNVNGVVIAQKKKNSFDKLVFRDPFDFTTFLKNLKTGHIFFDSGMYEGNNRNYSHFRTNDIMSL